jgi:hypothetical protein
MSSDLQAETKPDSAGKSFQNHGAIYGFLLGGIAGALVAGPNFQIWTPLQSLITIFGACVVIGLIGHFSFALFLGGVGAASTDTYVNKSTDEPITLNNLNELHD